MSFKPRILVTSAAGKTGLPTSLALIEAGYPVRAFVRRDDERAQRLRAAGAELFVGDLFALADMRAAMRGVQRAYHCAPTAPNGLHFSAVFAIAAREAGLEHVVTLSQWLSQPHHPSLFTREVWLTTELLGMLPGTTLTEVNAGWFADNYFMVLEPAAQLGILPMPLGPGGEKSDAPPSNEDIAAVIAGALMNPDTHAGKVYRPTGPDLLSPDEIADAMGAALGRKVRYRNIPERMFLKALTALRPVNFSDATLTQLNLYTKEYRRGAFAVGAPTDAVRIVAGRPPEDFATIARRMVAARPEARRSIANRTRALVNFAKIAATRTPDPARIEARRGHVLLSAPEFASDNAEWLSAHSSGDRASVSVRLAAVS